MTALVGILLGELLLVSLSVSMLYFMILRRRRKRLLEAMDSLLLQLQQNEPMRLQQLQAQLSAAYRGRGDSVVHFSEKLLADEKAFLRTLLQALITRDLAALAHLHEFLQRLMDTQIRTIADAIHPATTEDTPTATGRTEEPGLVTGLSFDECKNQESQEDESLPPLFDPNEGDMLSADQLAETLPTLQDTLSEQELDFLDATGPQQDEMLPLLTPADENDIDFPQPLAPSAMDEPEMQAFEEAPDFPEDLSIDSINDRLAPEPQTDEGALELAGPLAGLATEDLRAETRLELPILYELRAQAVPEQPDEAQTIVDRVRPEVGPKPTEAVSRLGLEQPTKNAEVQLTAVAKTNSSTGNEEAPSEPDEKPARKTRKRSTPRAKQKKDTEPAEETDEQG